MGELKPGEIHRGIFCTECLKPVLLDMLREDEPAEEEGKYKVSCKECGHANTYGPDDRQFFAVLDHE